MDREGFPGTSPATPSSSVPSSGPLHDAFEGQLTAREDGRAGMEAENANLREELGASRIRVRQAAREIERLKALLESKDMQLASAARQTQRSTPRFEALARQQFAEQGAGMEVAERELAQTKRQLADAQEEIQGLQYLLETQRNASPKISAEDERVVRLEDTIEDLQFDLQVDLFLSHLHVRAHHTRAHHERTHARARTHTHTYTHTHRSPSVRGTGYRSGLRPLSKACAGFKRTISCCACYMCSTYTRLVERPGGKESESEKEKREKDRDRERARDRERERDRARGRGREELRRAREREISCARSTPLPPHFPPTFATT